MKSSHSAILDRLHTGHRKPENVGSGRSGPAPFHDDEYVHLIVENARDLIFHAQLKPEFKFDYVSPSSTRMTGYTPEEFYADPGLVKKCIHPDDFKLLVNPSSPDAPSTSKPLDVRWTCKDSHMIWTEQLVTITRNKRGEPVACQIIARDITKRKNAEAALLETQNFNASLMEHAPHATVVINPDTSIKYVNPAWEKLNGWTLAEVAGMKTPYPWWPAEFKDAFAEGFKEAMKLPSGKGEVVAQKKSGELYWIDMNWAAVMNNGDLLYTLINSVDITERKQAEEKQLAIIKTALDGFWICNMQGKFLEVNDSYCKMTGYTREELLKMSIKDIEATENPEQISQRIKKIVAQGSDRFETQHKQKDGKLIDIEISVNYFNTGEGQMFIFVRDITERKKQEQALANEATRRRILIEQSSDGIVILDQNGAVFEANRRFAEMLGYYPEEMSQLNVWDWEYLYPPERVLEMIRTIDEAGDHFETRHRRKDGSVYDVEISTSGTTYGGQKLVFCVCRDITERKRMEQALRESEEKFSVAFRSSPEMIIITDVENNKYLEINDNYANAIGYSREEVMSHKVDEFQKIWVKPEELKKMTNLMQTQGKVKNEEFSFRTKSGEIRQWMCSAEMVTIGGKQCMLAVSLDITGRKRIEKALRESEEKFSAAFHSSPDMIIITDTTEGKYIDVNESFVQNTGYTREELVGHSISEFNLWVDPVEVEKFTRTLQEQGKIRSEVYKFRRKTGEVRTWLCSADVVTIGGEIRMLAVAADITERKKAEEALKESEEKFSKAFNASPFSISISRLGDGKFIEVNESFLRDKGYTREELIGHSSKDFNIWANQQESAALMKTVKAHGQVQNQQMQYRTQSGHVRTGLVSAEIINIRNEPCMLVMNSDITQQKLAEEQLRLLSSVTQQVSDSTIITDPHLKITYINQAAQNLFGYTIEEVRGKSLSFFDEIPLSDEVLLDMSEKLSKSKLWKGTNTKRHKNGNPIICDCRISPLYDEKGQICSYIDVQRDVTRQKEVEAKLQEHKKLIDSILATMPEGVLVIDSKNRIVLANKAFGDIFHIQKTTLKNKRLDEVLPDDRFFDLHKAVQSGATENTTLEFRYPAHGMDKIIGCIIVKMDGERKLITFSDISKERDEEEKLYLTDRLASLGEMAAGLAHELNNPLTGILALSQMLVASNLPAENKEDLECIYSEAKRAAAIVKNVLLFARNKTDVSGRTTINDVVTDVLRLREYEQKASNIKVVTELEENLPEIPVDKGQLQQVFLNFISNAEAAIREVDRPGVITVATQRVNSHVNILFSDNGCGIKKQIMPRIFDPFFTTKEIGKGTGLGLSICYSIIVKHGGKISVKSQVNEGTTFTIRMPIVIPER